MSGYISKHDLAARGTQRRMKDVTVPGLGTLRLRTITAREFARIDAARNRALLAASSGKMKEQVAALHDQFVELVKAVVAEPQFTDEDRELLLALDSSVADALRGACYEHCELREVDVETIEKNSPPTSGGSSPTG